MTINILAAQITLQFTTPYALSQAALTLMLIALGIIIVGASFGHLAKTKLNLQQHRWFQSAAILLTVTTVFLVMIPSLFRFLIDPNVQIQTTFSIATLIHAALGALTLTTAVTFAFNDLPNKTRKWMKITALLWATTLIVGVLLFLQTNQVF